MAIDELKERLHLLINETNNEILLEDLLNEAESRVNSSGHVLEGLSEEDYNELAMFAKEENPEKDTITFDELKSSLGKWFTK